ncbi:uncharacterized protein IL334_006582 [Kwoniella shivajii]|uniref:DUF2428 domain-containing protein n=1 Tax=Kwoniella shivajii TaxID=564305 RepID=A0ABZ1D6C4_9TREE|nr:hypothetical protein IL334_006582 [Kwoniella shivajii]
MNNRLKNDEGMEELFACRKELMKAKGEDLKDGVLIAQGMKLVLQPYSQASHLKILDLLLVILRQVTFIVSSLSPPEVVSLTENHLVPAFIPGGILASLVLNNLESTLKLQQQRASEALSSAGKLSMLLPGPSTSTSESTTFVVPLFQQAIHGGISRKSNLTIISTLLEYIPLSIIPNNLIDDLLDDLVVVECALIRSTLIVNLLQRLSSGLPENEMKSSVLGKLIPCFDPTLPHSVMANMNRYLLPALFKSDPTYVPNLLDTLRSCAKLFGTWVTVASLGLSLGLVKVTDLPREDLRDALAHEDADIRIKAFELVSGSKAHFSQDVLELIKEGFRWNDALPSAGTRSTFSSSTYALLVRLHQLETSTRRVFRKKLSPTVEVEQASLSHILPSCQSFRHWFLVDHIDPGLRQARRFPVFKILLSLNLLGRYLEVFGATGDTQEKVYTKDRVEMLFNCQMSEYTEVRTRARKILESSTIPLPGYETLSTLSSQALLNSALSSINLPRKTQAEAGKSVLCILFIKLVKDDRDQSLALDFVGFLIQSLARGIEEVEQDLVKGMEEYPLHGSLAAIRDLLSCLDLSSNAKQSLWKSTFQRLFTLINRIWNVTRPVISLAPSTTEGAADSARPDHEIARAYEVMGGEEGEDEEGGEEMDHTGLLSGCWRATRNAGELLASIVSLPLVQSTTSQCLWSEEDISLAGQCFLTWMHEIRHRGTFSKIAIAFAQLVEAVRPIPNIRGLCDEWLDHELNTIASDQHSTTRRSAALPYSILSLVSSDEELLTTALNSLLGLARVENHDTSNVTKVHAFNVLKIVMLDARQTKWFTQWFEKGVITALGAFESADWNVRNVGLILFSTLVHRCLSPPRGGQDYYRSRSILATRTSFSTFHTKYPLVIPFITKHLQNNKTEEGRHSPLFPILIILRSLRYDDGAEDLVKELRRVVGKYLSSKEYQVRQVASQALSSLTSPSHSLDIALSISATMDVDSNSVHGHLLFLQQLIANVIPWYQVSIETKISIEEMLRELAEQYIQLDCPSTAQAILGCIGDYTRATSPSSSVLVEKVTAQSTNYLNTRTDTHFVPGEDAGQIACTRFLLSTQPNQNLLISLLSSTSSETDHILALKKLPSLPHLWSKDMFDTVLNIAISGRGGETVQIIALEDLAEINWSREILTGVKGKWKRVIGRLNGLSGTGCIPLREAGLVALGWAVHQSIVNEDVVPKDGLKSLSHPIMLFSQEDESLPSRFSALRSLSHITSHLFASPSSALHRTLLRLLQDDDEGVQLGAAVIIFHGLGRKRGLVQAKTMEMWWDWLEGYLYGLKDREEWIKWITELAKDKPGLDNDLTVINKDHTSDVIFEIEPNNIFRDPLIDSYYANRLLASLNVERPEINRFLERGDQDNLYSPIDEEWEARRTINRRRDYSI